ncbi:nucleotidyltransferase domain-containing protein [Spirosoma rhododendri]|uniref:Nucleotidyltransferase domain-containing protein n=1 Tax=Spirosoma rhododendri TaxID=2728024 RepID=A0A7L5DRN5_9BACT|nr:nucleotidyltransferase domain-containing protein [Spirosoma rhododendri]QJD80272.1 nucleotidyltransferase domain-containing protein [Spirosoma rhododendri]
MNLTYTPHALTPEQLTALSQELKQALTDLYGPRLDRLVLYGSYARGDYHAESDVDFLVVLRDEPVRAGREVRQMAAVVGPLALKYGVEVSVFPTGSHRYTADETLFLRSATTDGIPL